MGAHDAPTKGKSGSPLWWLLLASLAWSIAAAAAQAQQITGVPGWASAIETIKGDVLPAPALPFGGDIKPNASQSKPWWPPRVAPPKEAPNVLLIMLDDAGYGAESTFGRVIPTPTLDRIKRGVAVHDVSLFHSAALCSPTRAALIMGRQVADVIGSLLSLRDPS